MQWRELRTIINENAQAYAVVHFYDEKMREMWSMGEAELRELHTKWAPKREALLAKFAPGSLEAEKMEAFYDALDSAVANLFPPKPKKSGPLEYIYDEDEQP